MVHLASVVDPDDRTAVQRAQEEFGHDVAWDPPGLSAARRYTCVRRTCGRAVLIYGANIYGSAVTECCVHAA